MLRPRPLYLVCALVASWGAAPGSPRAAPSSEAVVLTLPEALELATRQAFAVRGAALSREDAEAQVRGAFATVLPQLRGSASYTRTIEALDPFAGSDAGSAFGGLDAVQWLRFNEEARTDGDTRRIMGSSAIPQPSSSTSSPPSSLVPSSRVDADRSRDARRLMVGKSRWS